MQWGYTGDSSTVGPGEPAPCETSFSQNLSHTVLTTLQICFSSRYTSISSSCLSSFLMHG